MVKWSKDDKWRNEKPKPKFPRGLKTHHAKRCDECKYKADKVSQNGHPYSMCQKVGSPTFVIIENGLLSDLTWECEFWDDGASLDMDSDSVIVGRFQVFEWKSGKGAFMHSEDTGEEFVIFAGTKGYNDIYVREQDVIIEVGANEWNGKRVVIMAGVVRDDEEVAVYEEPSEERT